MTKHYTKAFSPQEKQAAIAKYADLIKYSARYSDDQYEYRFVVGNAKSPKLQPYSPTSTLIHLPLLLRLLLCNRHVCLPKALVKYLPAGIASEDEWRGIGVRQSPGWEMYMRHEPEPHVLLFKRDKDYDQKHPPLTERRTQPQARQRQAPAQNLS